MASVGWASAATAQTVHEVTIATPNMIAIEVRDAPFVAGGIEPLPVASSQEQGTWIDVGGRWGRVIGPGKNHMRISDTPPSQYLDRALVDDASG
jgi:endoglucanase